MEKYWDPLRKREVAATPEEKIRQWFIKFLRDVAGVPEHMMMSEVGMKFGRKNYRADILVYGRDAKPAAVVECKREEVELSEEVAEQALRYNMVLDVRYIILTNGVKTLVFRRDGKDTFRRMECVPTYESMQEK